ncbi:2-phosphoxylose phosphatase 1 [Culicoides brevitarsis]|uniref:2-phosphoxylose phosphatase 1 n=1 Tax=Culicoides brevitarsis TaxID=469753 RepID=UPI00307BBCE4
MLIKDVVRFSSQHRTLYCYLILSIWIFLIVAGMYKYMGVSDPSSNFMTTNGFYASDATMSSSKKDQENYKRHKMHEKDCNPTEVISAGDDGGVLESFSLQGVLLLTRHGDRGPMTHVRGINDVDCDQDGDTLLNKYRTFVQNLTTATSTTSGLWQKMGNFHGFPLLPPTNKACLLGQLTSKGVSQMLKIGEIIRNAYMAQLNFYQKNGVFNRQGNTTTEATPIYDPDEIIIYSTRYRRTFQSAMALMYAFIPSDRWHTLQIQEAHSYNYCFSDCACQKADQLQSAIEKNRNANMAQHPAVNAIVQWVGSSLLENPAPNINALDVRDAVLALVCHGAPLPCRFAKKETNDDNENENIGGTSTVVSDADVINIDQDDSQAPTGSEKSDETVDDVLDEIDNEAPEGCIDQSQVDTIMSFTRYQGTKDIRSKDNRDLGLLRAYGLMRELNAAMLRMISGDKVKFVLYSAHDRTIQNLASALGVFLDVPFIPYATRMNFEVYKSEKDTQFYFRVVYNGQDITNQISFCEGGRSLRVNRGIRGSKADLCPIENIIRFIHDDYFQNMNATNFKDACQVTTTAQREYLNLNNY